MAATILPGLKKERSHPLPVTQNTIYTLKRPTLAKRPLSAIASSTNRFREVLSPMAHTANGSRTRPSSALTNSFVTWTSADHYSRVADDELVADDYVIVDDDEPTNASVSPAPAALRPTVRPASAGVSRLRSAPIPSRDAWFSPTPSHGVDATAASSSMSKGNSIEKIPLTPVKNDLQQERPIAPEHHTFLTPTPAEPPHVTPPPAAPRALDFEEGSTSELTSPSRKVNSLRDAAAQAREVNECGPNNQEPKAPPPVAAVEEELPTDIFKIDVRKKFADFVDRDKYFEKVFKVCFEHEFQERLELSMLQTSHRNVHYVAMTKVYLRWAETGLNPGDPDPPFTEDPSVTALRSEQHRRNVDNIVIKESNARSSIEQSADSVLSALQNSLYLMMEEESIRSHITDVFEPQRWDSITRHIDTFLSTRLVTSYYVFKAWSLAVGEVEREQDWQRSLLQGQFLREMKTVKLDKLQVSEGKRREMVLLEERIKFGALLHAHSTYHDILLEQGQKNLAKTAVAEAVDRGTDRGEDTEGLRTAAELEQE